MDKERKKDIKAYRKMQKVFTKKLIRAAKDFKPFDWSYMFNMLQLMVDNFEAYYKGRNNVVQIDESADNILEQLTEIQGLLTTLHEDDFDAEAYEFAKAHTITTTENFVTYSRWDSEESAKTWRQLIDQSIAKRDAAWSSTFQKLGEYMQFWWD